MFILARRRFYSKKPTQLTLNMQVTSGRLRCRVALAPRAPLFCAYCLRGRGVRWYDLNMSKKSATTADAQELLPNGMRSDCPIACVLDVIGDKWTLIVIRDLVLGKTLFSELQAAPEGIPSNILSDRLKRLEADDIISRTPYQTKPVRYAYGLTEKGRDLQAVLGGMIRWADKHLPQARSVEFSNRPHQAGSTAKTKT